MAHSERRTSDTALFTLFLGSVLTVTIWATLTGTIPFTTAGTLVTVGGALAVVGSLLVFVWVFFER